MVNYYRCRAAQTIDSIKKLNLYLTMRDKGFSWHTI